MTNAEIIKAIRENEECNDCAIAIHDDCNDRKMRFAAAYALEAADKRIADLEAQMSKEGEWIDENRRTRSSKFVCSTCKRTCYDIQPTRDKAWTKRCRYNYCPNCGARMRGEQE